METYELELCEGIAEIKAGLFDELEGPETYPFLRREFLLAFEEAGCVGADRGWVPRHILVRRGREEVAFIPAYIKLHSFGEFVFDHGWADFSESRLGVRYYPKLILAVPFTPATGPRVLFRRGTGVEEREAVFDLVGQALPEICDRIGLSSVHGLFVDVPTEAEFLRRGFFVRRGMQFQFSNPGYPDFAAFLSQFRAKRRAAIRRECRALSDQGIEITVKNGAAFERDDGRLAHELYLTTVDKHVWGRRYLSRAFFERVLQSMPESIHFVVAKDERGEVLAGAFNLLGKEALYGRYWGTFVDVPYLHFNVCLYEGVRECLRRGLSRFEPGAGGAHKEGRGFAPTFTQSVHYVKDARLDAAVRDFCRREAEELDVFVTSRDDAER